MRATAYLATATAGVVLLISVCAAKPIDGQEAFRNKCQLCHTVETVTADEKDRLPGPPADEVMLHVKERYPVKADAIRFIVDYTLEPAVEKALCASMDKFGLMPSMQKAVTLEEAQAIAEMMFDTFPRPEYARKEKKSREGITFATLDTNADGYITPEEFRIFRAKRNGIDPKKFKANLYFQKVDINHDGRMSPEEFEAMRMEKAQNR